MTDKAIDIDLPETFHRLKRTVLLLSSALIVLTIATPAPQHRVNLGLVDLEVSTWIALIGLWIAGAYYLAGFIVEVRIARRLNSTTMRSGGVRRFDEKVGDNIEAAGRLRARLEDAVKKLEMVVGRLDHNARADRRMIRSSMEPALLSTLKSWSVDTEPLRMTEPEWPGGPVYPVYHQRIEHLLDQLSETAFSPVERSQMVETVNRYMQESRVRWLEIEREIKALVPALEKTHHDISRLSPRIDGERRASFWAWDVGGAVTVFAVATVLLAAHLVSAPASDAIAAPPAAAADANGPEHDRPAPGGNADNR